jgi:hypothetical protein
VPILGWVSDVSVALITHEMPYLWATQEPEIPDEAMQAEATRVQAELAAIDAVGDEQACRICKSPDLTEEHTPSKKAGNPARIVRGSIDYDESVRRGASSTATTRRSICTPTSRANGRSGSTRPSSVRPPPSFKRSTPRRVFVDR